MGGGNQKAVQFFTLQHPSKLVLRNSKPICYYFIQPHRDATFDATLNTLRQYFKLDYFPEIKTLKQQMSFINESQYVKVIASAQLWQEDFEYLQNQSKIKQIILIGDAQKTPNLSKIAGKAYTSDQLVELLNQLQVKDSLQLPSASVLLVQHDTKMLNRYRLNFQGNTRFNARQKAKQDLLIAASQLFPQQKDAIQEFKAKYDLTKVGEEKHAMIIEWMFRNSFYWEMASTLTRTTNDPKRLGYIRLILKDIFQTIRETYKQNKKKLQYFVVVELNQQQQAKLQKSQKGQKNGGFLLFTSFVKGYLSKGQANQVSKTKPNLFTFNIQHFAGERQQQLDFGFVVRKDPNNPKKGEVIFNIYNVFRIDQFNIKTKSGTIVYGALAALRQKRKLFAGKNQRLDRQNQLNLVRNYDYLEDKLAKVDTQAMILQLAGYFQESLQIYDKTINGLRQSSESVQSIDGCILKKAQALRISGNLQAAQKQYTTTKFNSQKMTLISQINLADLYLQQGNDEKFDKIVESFQGKLTVLQKNSKDQFFRGRNMVVLKTMRKGGLKKAEAMLQTLIGDITQAYPQTFQSKPMVHDIYRSFAACQSKMGKHKQALTSLKSTLAWQMKCEGKTVNVALTETLIQSVTRSAGNVQQLQESQKRMAAISEEIEPQESRFDSGLNKSLVSITI